MHALPTVETAPTARRITNDSSLQDSYDREAARYDERRYRSAEGRLFSDLEGAVVRSWLSLDARSKALDMPAGTGRLTLALGETEALVVGTDISLNMLHLGASKAAPGTVRRVHFTQGNGIQLPFADNTFDAVTSFKFFHLIPNERKRLFIDEMMRVLKPGRPLVVEFNSPFYGVVLAWLRYRFRKKRAGGMRMKCLFPGQLATLFSGLEVTRRQGVKLPFSGALSRIIGRRAAMALNLWFGRLPAARYLTYAIIIEARKPVLKG